MTMRYEVKAWVGVSAGSAASYRRVWSRRRAQLHAMALVKRYQAEDVRDFRIAIFDGRKPLVWFLYEEGNYRELYGSRPAHVSKHSASP
jgi:hypothetical protein